MLLDDVLGNDSQYLDRLQLVSVGMERKRWMVEAWDCHIRMHVPLQQCPHVDKNHN
jgi:hypothetical protein